MISIIVPAYNIEKYIADCLDSLLAQTYRDLEIIVVNDGSKDGTQKILEEYAKRDVRIRLLSQKNAGASAARNAGIDASQGRYIGFCDGDDTVEPQMYETLRALMEANDAEIAQCGYRMITADHVENFYGTQKIHRLNREEALCHLIEGAAVGPALWNKLYKRELFKEVRLNPEIKINEDVLMNYYLIKNCRRFVYWDEILYNYQLREGSATTNMENIHKLTDPIKVFAEIYQDCKNDPELADLAWSRYLRNIAINVMCRTSIEKESRKLLRKELKNQQAHITPKSLEIQTLLAAHFPWSIQTIRKLAGKNSV